VGDRLLCAGPGRLCQALGITRALDGAPMGRSPVVVREPPAGAAVPVVACTPRIGITKAADWPLRFVVENSPYLSKRIRNATKPLDR
jgi:DNA-3-methyladenine glycosylase